MIAKSGTYKIHRTNAKYGTLPKNVKPVCGQSVSRSYLSVINPATEAEWLADAADPGKIPTLCKKCFDV